MKKSLLASTALLAGVLFVSFFAVEQGRSAGADGRGHGFNLNSLRGSYGTTGRADGSKSVSVGVAEFDGQGKVTRFVRINASGQDGERRLIDITSVGTYSVDPDGLGVIYFTNTLPNGSTSEVTFDFVIQTSGTRQRRGSLRAEKIFAVQREAGITASLIEEFQRGTWGVNGYLELLPLARVS